MSQATSTELSEVAISSNDDSGETKEDHLEIAHNGNKEEQLALLKQAQMLWLLQLLQSHQNEVDDKHEIPRISPRAVAAKLDNHETLLNDIESGLSYIQCIGIIDVINQILTDNGYQNIRKDDEENWLQYTNSLSVMTPYLSFLDFIGFGIQTGYRIIIQCKLYESTNDYFDIFKFLGIGESTMTPVFMTCNKCKQELIDKNEEKQMPQSAWNTDLKFSLLDSLYKQCMKLKQMKPKYNVEQGKDLPTDIILKELENKNDGQSFIDLLKLSQDIEKYEISRKNESEFIKTCKSDWKGKEICNFTEKQVSEWAQSWKATDLTTKRKYYFELIAVLSQAIKLCNNYYPRHTQIIPIFISIGYEFNHFSSIRDDKRKGILFEIGTGEGKSVVVMLMAAMQNLLFNNKVDIATSQTLLAQREADETTKYFKMLNLGSNGAEYIDADGREDCDKLQRQKSYKSPIIYSTPYNYQCDLLHTNSGKW